MSETSESTTAGSAAAKVAAGGDANRFVRHANLMSGLTIVSRVAGLLRDKLWSAYLCWVRNFHRLRWGFSFRICFGGCSARGR